MSTKKGVKRKKDFSKFDADLPEFLASSFGVATAGTFANMPVGTPHSFKNESNQPAKMIISIAPAGLEEMFFEFGVPLSEGSTSALPPTKKEIEKLLAIAPTYGIEIRVSHHG